MKMPDQISPAMLAPCGVNCAGCHAHHKRKKPCQGCNGPNSLKNPGCAACPRKSCADAKGISWCFACGEFPCPRLKTLDRSYRTRYGIYLIKRGKLAAKDGVDAVLKRDRERLSCRCGGVVCQTDGICSDCGQAGELPPEQYPE